MRTEESWVTALRDAPEDEELRLVFADWLDDQCHPGSDFIRTETALARASDDDSVELRRRLLDIIPTLPSGWRHRFEQPDLILAPPVPFEMGWRAANSTEPTPYRSLTNLDETASDPEMPWLSGEGVEPRTDQAEYEQDERTAFAEVQKRVTDLGLVLPPGFEAFVEDYPRRNAISEAESYFEVILHDSVIGEFPQVAEGYLIGFFSDMNYGNPHQCLWSLYLVPGIPWHCVVVYELPDDDPTMQPESAEELLYCSPSFQSFLYRWWLETSEQTP